ncbi:hypothetical protein Slin15195_G056200 [Septoria linicola]|uniref:DUF7730 domain-containing protein n=1 Tax=Septoria linicola TaxID=215465 RepID=A0A9Q9AX73_9PEZI|nr:hypothetical protein Slin14017_G072080 [Septoria linicola]USW52301.1 hypothetical protein Slin15195_G056200 [Septoria linicola]
MVDLASWSDFALRTFVNISPSPQWANRQIEPYLGLPFGAYLRARPPARFRRLTAPLRSAEDSIWHKLQVLTYLQREQHTKDQMQSSFISKLPYDVRVLIYDLILGGNVFHCSAPNQKSRITHYVCSRPCHIEHEGSRHKCSDASYGQLSVAGRSYATSTSGLLALLLTCRQVYSEAMPALYGGNTFVFSQNFAAFTFLKLTIPPSRLPQIRHFRLHMRIPRHPDLNGRSNRDWAVLWMFFGTSMTGLQKLYLELQMLQPTEAQIEATSDEEAESWVRPIIVMACEASRRRGCQVELETRGVRHHPAQIHEETIAINRSLTASEALSLSCVTLHRRIRLSLG